MRAVCATVLAWATMVAVTSAFDVTDPVRITLFAAGAAFEGALLAPDPQPMDRVRTLGWASVVAAAAVVVTVELTRSAVWAAAVLLVLLMFSVVRAAVLESAGREPGADGRHHRLHHRRRVHHARPDRMVRPRAVVGFGWLALWEAVILPDRPLRSLDLSVQAFSRRAADTVSGTVDALNTAPGRHVFCRRRKGSAAAPRPGKECRSAIERQSPGAVVRGFSQNDADRLGVALHSAQKGLEDMAAQAIRRTGCGPCPARSPHRSAAPCTLLPSRCAMTSTRNPGAPPCVRPRYCAATLTKR